MAVSSSLWELGKKAESVRPLMCILAASEQEIGPLMANLREHGQATVSGGGIGAVGTAVAMEFPRRAGYAWSAPQPIPEHAAVAHHIHHADTFGFVPVAPEAEVVKFAAMPAFADLDEVLRLNQADLEDARAHAFQLDYPVQDLHTLGVTPRFIALAAVWAKTLQRRTIWAVPQKLAFRVQLLLACLKQGVVTMGDRDLAPVYGGRPWWNAGAVSFTSMVHPGLPLHTGLATMVTASALEAILAVEVGRFDYMRRKKTAAVAGAPAGGKKVA